jgi:hypothetical protein
MAEIDPEGGIASRYGKGDPTKDQDWNKMNPRASCPNCSQTIPRLYRLAGMNPPGGAIEPGARDDGSGPFGTTPARQGFHTGDNAQASPIAGMDPQPHRPRPGTFNYSEGGERFRKRR